MSPAREQADVRDFPRSLGRRFGAIQHRLVRHNDHVLRNEHATLAHASEQSHASTAGRLGQNLGDEVRRHAICVGHLDLIEHSHPIPLLRVKPQRSIVGLRTQQENYEQRLLYQNGTSPLIAGITRASICTARGCNRVRAS